MNVSILLDIVLCERSNLYDGIGDNLSSEKTRKYYIENVFSKKIICYTP